MQSQSKTKLILMFAPLVLFFIGFAALVGDMKHPVTTRDQCTVSATGPDVSAYQSQGRYIYRHTENPAHDVSLRCNRFGTLLLNDRQLFMSSIKRGQAASVALRQYRILPERWAVSIHTGPEPKKQPVQ